MILFVTLLRMKCTIKYNLCCLFIILALIRKLLTNRFPAHPTKATTSHQRNGVQLRPFQNTQKATLSIAKGEKGHVI